MSESTLTKKINSLEVKGLVRRESSGRRGTVLRIVLPTETAYSKPKKLAAPEFDAETIDFYSDPRARSAILAREQNLCFYCLASLENRDFVMEHVVSRPLGDNSYQNIVAACQRCNNQKGALDAWDFLRLLLRTQKISENEFSEVVQKLDRLGRGLLKPKFR